MKTAIKLFARVGFVLAGLVLLPNCGGSEDSLIIAGDSDAGAGQRPQVTFNISNGGSISGTMVITLLPEYAPKTVANFLAYVNANFYNNTIIHRYQAGFVMQGGGYAAPVAATDQPTHKAVGPAVELELKVSNVLGTVAMARTNGNPNSATSEFFINLANNDFLDSSAGGYAAFGYISNLTLVNAMKQTACVQSNVASGSLGCLPVPNLVITAAAQTRF